MAEVGPPSGPRNPGIRGLQGNKKKGPMVNGTKNNIESGNTRKGHGLHLIGENMDDSTENIYAPSHEVRNGRNLVCHRSPIREGA